MRISTNMALDQFLFQQQRLASILFSSQVKLSTGREVIVPSDNPLQASRMLRLSETEEMQEQVLENIRFASDFLDTADAAMTGITDSLIRVNELALGAVNGIALPDERRAAAIEIDSIITELVRTANHQYLGLYVFGGQDVETAPVVAELGGIHYVGDTGELRTRVAEDGIEDFNLTADDVFGMLSSRVQGFVDLNPAVARETRLDELSGANNLGVRLGTLQFVEDGPTGTYYVDLAEANSVGQIIDLINQAAATAGSALTAGINAANNGLLITSGDPVMISTLDNGVLAGDLGIVANVSTSDLIVGEDLNRLVTNTTPIADLMGGAGIDFTDSTFRIRNDDYDVSIDLTTAKAVQDILNTINNTGIGVRAVVNDEGTGIDVLNEVSGMVMHIEEEGGTAAADLGIRSLALTTLLDELNFGNGVQRIEGKDDIQIVAKDGGVFAVNFDTAETIEDILNLINSAATDAGIAVEASLATAGNGIRIVDTTGGAGGLQINRLNLSAALDGLGLDVAIEPAATEAIGSDVNGIRVNGAFTSLIDLRDALLAGDERDITDAASRAEVWIGEVARIQGIVGAEVRAMEGRAARTQEAVDATRVLLSEVRDVDYAEAITKFQQAQTVLQASLMATSQALNVSLLNFLS